ncbi:MAG: FixH family protein [Candidatus Binatia bacterium]
MNRTNTQVAAPLPGRSRQRTDSKPWYRQFWPWFLILLPATSVVFSFATLYVALRDADEVLPHEGDSTSYSAPSAALPSGSAGQASPPSSPQTGNETRSPSP